MWNSLRVRLSTLLIFLAVGPLLLTGLILAQRTLAAEQAQALDLQRQVAQSVATEIENFFQEVINDLNNLGADIRGLENPDRAQQLSLLLNALSSGTYRDDYEAFILLDGAGQEILRISRDSVVPSDELESLAGTDLYEQPKATRDTYLSPVWFDQSTGKPFISVAIPIFQPRSVELSNVLIAAVRFETVGTLMARISVGEGQILYMVDENGLAIAHQDRNVVLQNIQVELPEDARRQMGSTAEEVILAVHKIQVTNRTFEIIAEKLVSTALELAYSTMITILIIIISALVLAIVVGILAVRQIVVPIEQLSRTASEIAAGDLSKVATIGRRDEIGVLAESFNTMTGQLRTLIGSLEQRVADRTRALETATQVSRSLSTILDPDILVTEVVHQVQQAFHYYHAHIYLFDPTREKLLMVGGTGEAGQTMLKNKHVIPAGKGLVGRAAEANTVVLVPETLKDPNWLPNPLLPETKAEVAVPITVGNTVLGVLDVQHNIAYGLTQEDADLLQAIANQVAIAIQNAQSYEVTRRIADRETIVNSLAQEIQHATQLEDVLQILATGLGQSLKIKRAVVQVQNLTILNKQN